MGRFDRGPSPERIDTDSALCHDLDNGFSVLGASWEDCGFECDGCCSALDQAILAASKRPRTSMERVQNSRARAIATWIPVRAIPRGRYHSSRQDGIVTSESWQSRKCISCVCECVALQQSTTGTSWPTCGRQKTYRASLTAAYWRRCCIDAGSSSANVKDSCLMPALSCLPHESARTHFPHSY